MVPVGQSFQPLVLRVTDGSPSADPVLGVSVTLQVTLALPSPDPGGGGGGGGDGSNGGNGQPVIVGSYQAQLTSDGNGLVSMVPTVEGLSGALDVFITATAGSATAQLQLEVEGAAGAPPRNGSHAVATRRSRTGSRTTSTAAADMLFAVPDFIVSETSPESPADSDSPPDEAPSESANPSSAICTEDERLVTNSSCSQAKAPETPKSEGGSPEAAPATGPKSAQAGPGSAQSH